MMEIFGQSKCDLFKPGCQVSESCTLLWEGQWRPASGTEILRNELSALVEMEVSCGHSVQGQEMGDERPRLEGLPERVA